MHGSLLNEYFRKSKGLAGYSVDERESLSRNQRRTALACDSTSKVPSTAQTTNAEATSFDQAGALRHKTKPASNTKATAHNGRPASTTINQHNAKKFSNAGTCGNERAKFAGTIRAKVQSAP